MSNSKRLSAILEMYSRGCSQKEIADTLKVTQAFVSSKLKGPLKVGDVVRLKSGGPFMVVNSRSENSDIIECAWFCDGNAMFANFKSATLVAAKAKV